MSDIGALVERLVAKGFSVGEAGEIIAEAVAAGAASAAYRKSPGAERQQRYRDRNKASRTVTTLRDDTASRTVTNRNERVTRDALSLSKEVSKKEEKRERARASQLPPDWKPGDEQWSYACEALGPAGGTAELAKFKNHALDKGRTSKNWNAAFRNWIDRAIEYRHAANSQNRSGFNGKPTVHDAAKELSRRLNELDEPAPGGELFEQAGGSVVRLLPSR